MNERVAFAIAIFLLSSACLYAGAMLSPLLRPWMQPKTRTAAEIAALLEHSAVDVRLGRAAPLVDELEEQSKVVDEPATKARLLWLWAESSLQAGRLSDAARAEALRETLATDQQEAQAIRLRRISLAAALENSKEADELAKPLISGKDIRLADEARLRLVSGMKGESLRAWVKGQNPSDSEDARRAGLAALRLLGDPVEAERLLAPLASTGTPDIDLLQALIEVYRRLDRNRDVARLAASLEPLLPDGETRSRVVLMQVEALARAGETDAALAAIEPLRTSPDFSVRQLGRRGRYSVLRMAGHLDGEVAALRDPDERAFVALEVQGKYDEAVRLYQSASSAHPDSAELFGGLQEAKRRLDLAERRALYQQLLAKDPTDAITREKLLSTIVSLGDVDAARKWVQDGLKGQENSPQALVTVAAALRRSGLGHEGAGYLERAYGLESDLAKKEEILFALGDLYAEAQQEPDARRVYTKLLGQSANEETHRRALGRLSTLLH